MKQTWTRLATVWLSIMLIAAVMLGVMTTDGARVEAQTVKLMGDIDLSGEVNTLDVREYLVLVLEKTELSAAQKAVGDLNQDGIYNTADARLILLLIVDGSSAVRATWIPYMEVESLLASGDPATCREAIDACMEDCVARGANTVYFHVRANSDAYYDSSVYDPGTRTATLLAKGFDPFACAVELAHEKGLLIEAWINPYRIGADASRAKVEAVFTYSGRSYYIPTDASVQELVVSGVREVVENYDIDGVQFDDYFYPSGAVSSSAPADFEQADYTAYTQAGGTLSVGDWRRAAVNELIAACYAVCHTRTDCVFGISPAYDFANNYDTMYADIATWAKTEGYVDYLCPQLYVGYEHAYATFDEVLESWNNLPRHASVTLVAGLALYKTGLYEDTYAGSAGMYEWVNNDDIMARQIALVKEYQWGGVALYSHLSFEADSTRDAAVAAAEIDAACKAWLVFA